MAKPSDSTALARAERRAAAEQRKKEKAAEEAAAMERLAEEKRKQGEEKRRKQEEKERAARAKAAAAEKEAATREEAARRAAAESEAAASALAERLAEQKAAADANAETPRAEGGGTTGGLKDPPVVQKLDDRFKGMQDMGDTMGGDEAAVDMEEEDGTYTGEETGGGDGTGGNEAEDETGEERDAARSPLKKRTRREKKKAEKAKKKAEKKAQKRQEAEAPSRKHARSTEGDKAPATPTANTSDAGNTPAPKGALRSKARKLDDYSFEYSRMLIQASVTLSEENRHAEYVQKLRGLLQEIQTVDPKFVYEPLEANDLSLRCEAQAHVPVNMTQVCGIFELDNKASFQDVEDWQAKNRAEQAGEDVTTMEFIKNPEVFFCFYFSCDKEPAQTLRRVKQEWERQGGKRLELKAIQSGTRSRLSCCTRSTIAGIRTSSLMSWSLWRNRGGTWNARRMTSSIWNGG